jgi:K+-sensing histidine kinase KdpD
LNRDNNPELRRVRIMKHPEPSRRSGISRTPEDQSAGDAAVRTFIHDVVNPIAAIRISAGVLRASAALTDGELTKLQSIEAAAEKIIRLVTTLGSLPRARQTTADEPAASPSLDVYVLCCEVAAFRRLVDGTEIQCRAFGDARGDWNGQQITTLVSDLLDHATARLGRSAPITVAVMGMARHVRVDVHGLGPPSAPKSRDVSYKIGAAPPGTTVNAIISRNGGIVFRLRLPRPNLAAPHRAPQPGKAPRLP